jgi:TolB-like protein/Tfp pilus assembly protein PilF
LSEVSHAVFLSYASQDAEAAQKICETLRTAGIEVFFDQSELRGGDAWDQKIRHEIYGCALFIPMVSQHTQARLEGYFRHEWKLAIERNHHMAEQKAFLLPVVVDGTRDQEAFVPDAFRAVQWTRLPGGETPLAFVERIKRLLSPDLSPLTAVSGAAPGIREPVSGSAKSKPVLLALVAAILLAALAYFVADRVWVSKHLAASATFAPPPHSIAVLPFVNLSGDKEQEYFSDGLTEELLNSLAQINDLQVAARTSSFSFRENPDIATVAHKLNVAAVLEGSVRRSEHTVRVTAQLINAVTGFHLWSKTYDRDLGDVLKLQTEIATAVANALEVTLLSDLAAKVELGGTRTPAAFDAYLRGLKTSSTAHDAKDEVAAIAAYAEATRLDPDYALALAGRSLSLSDYAANYATGPAIRASFDSAQADARRAIARAPALAEGHVALAWVLEVDPLDFVRAAEEYQRAVSLAQGDAQVNRRYASFATLMGQADAGIAAARRAVRLDPLNPAVHGLLSSVLLLSRRYDEAIEAAQETLALDPDNPVGLARRGIAYYLLGDYQHARASCEATQPRADPAGTYYYIPVCLAITYQKLGRHAAAEAQLASVKSWYGDRGAFQYAEVSSQWGDTATALAWLETGMRLNDSGLSALRIDPLLDPVRNEPRFQAIERALKFPPQ